MKKLLQKKLSSFIIPIISGAMLFSARANAQIIYTDVNPNMVLSCTFQTNCSPDYSLDLNNDGINDFVLSARKKYVSCGACGSLILVMANGDSAVVISTASSWIANTAGGYALNALIDSSLGWTNSLTTLAAQEVNCVSCAPSPGSHLVHSPASGPWLNVYGKYLALKIQVGTNFYYGWVRLAVSMGSNTISFTIMDYAYNSISGQPILAGDKGTTAINDDSFASTISLFPNPATNHLTIDLGSSNKKAEVTITDITGKVIYKTATRDSQELEVNTKDFAAGIYVVQIQSEDFIATKKLVVEK